MHRGAHILHPLAPVSSHDCMVLARKALEAAVRNEADLLAI
jgi:hypothetical protein